MYKIPDDILEFFFSEIIKRGKCRVEKINDKIWIKSRLEHEYYKPCVLVEDLEKLKISLINYINEVNIFIKKYDCILEKHHDLSYLLNNIFLNMTSSDTLDMCSYINRKFLF